MAEGMATETRGHNSKARQATIRELMTALDDQDSRIREIQEERKRTKGRVKSDLGMKVSDFNVLRRFYQLEDEPRDELMDVLREGFRALNIGVQSSFLEAIDPQPAKPQAPAKPPKGKLPTLEECRELGGIVFRAGDAIDAFPETIRTAARRAAWIEGWQAAEAGEKLRKMQAEDAEFEKDADFETAGDESQEEQEAEAAEAP